MLCYAATAPLVYLLTSKMRKTAVIIFGYAIIATGMFLVGPSKLLNI
jgi:predicted MFS family arabinose efflux permease